MSQTPDEIDGSAPTKRKSPAARKPDLDATMDLSDDEQPGGRGDHSDGLIDVTSLIGEKVGVYKVLEKLAEGGMGCVLKAHDQNLNRFVALKLLHKRLSHNQVFVQQFKVEAEALAKLNHPNVVNVYSSGTENGVVYFAMQFIRGHELTELLRQQTRVPQRTAVDLMLQVVEGLAYTHSYGILHRDLKPANVMIDETTGRPIVTDFGLAKIDVDVVRRRIDPDGTLHIDVQDLDERRVMGTPAYMAPELFARELYTGEDAQADVYAIGVILYQLVTGVLPYGGDSVAEIFQNALEQTPKPISNYVKPPLSAALVRCIMKAMARDPKDRYSSMERLQKDLQEVSREWHQADEIRQKAEMSREMAMALGSGGLARQRGNPMLRRALIWGILALVGLGLFALASNGFGGGLKERTPTAAEQEAGFGTRATDDQLQVGSTARVFGSIEILVNEGAETIVTVYDVGHDDGRRAKFRLPETAWEQNLVAKSLQVDAAILLAGKVLSTGGEEQVAELVMPDLGPWFFPLQAPVLKVFSNDDAQAVAGLEEEHLDKEVQVQGSIVRMAEGTDRSGGAYLECEVYQNGITDAENPPATFTVTFFDKFPRLAEGREARIGDFLLARGTVVQVSPELIAVEVAGEDQLAASRVNGQGGQ